MFRPGAQPPQAVPPGRFRPAQEAYDWVRWDDSFDRSAFVIGYDDHNEAPIEIPFDAFIPGGDIPWHRLMYFRCGAEIVWDRTRRIDRLDEARRPRAR